MIIDYLGEPNIIRKFLIRVSEKRKKHAIVAEVGVIWGHEPRNVGSL